MGALALTACCLLLVFLATMGITPARLFASGVGLVVLSGLTFSSFAFYIALSLFASAIVVRTLAGESTTARLAIMLGLAGVGFCLIAVPRWKETIERVRARDSHAYESMRERTRPVAKQIYEVQLSEKGAEEATIADYFDSPPWNTRARAIAWLHRSAVGHFLETPDFGVLRMGYPALRHLENGDGSPIELPGIDDAYPPVQSADSFASYQHNDARLDQQLSSGHRTYQNWFLDANRFGDIDDLDHVAGFLSHAIVHDKDNPRDIQSPLQAERRQENLAIRLTKLQLVGLLYHAEPVVYELDTMPELLSAETAPTRSLDSFEERGLKRLLDGEFIHVEQLGHHIRMMGSLRSSRSCVQCHKGPTNQLLGAFSYVLNSAEVPELPAPTEPGQPLTMQFPRSW